MKIWKVTCTSWHLEREEDATDYQQWLPDKNPAYCASEASRDKLILDIKAAYFQIGIDPKLIEGWELIDVEEIETVP